MQLGPRRLGDRAARRRGLVELELHAPHAVGELLAGELFAEARHHDGKRERRRLVRLAYDDRRGRHATKGLGEPAELELALEHFALGLAEQRSGGGPAPEELLDETGR